MKTSRLIAIVWRRVSGFFRSDSKQRNERTTGQFAGLSDEAPLHTDGFYNHMRSLQGPFFE